jgi:hypothetical protein
MPCHHEEITVTLPDGTTRTMRAIVCIRGSRSERPQTCIVCHRDDRSATLKLCDYPLRGHLPGQTCDRVICTLHATHRDPDTDLCPAHGRLMDAEVPT